MYDKQSHKNNNNRESFPETDRLLHAFSLEYQTLRDELLTRTSGRFQFLGFMTTAAALLVAGVGGSSSGARVWISAGIAAVVFGVGLISFFWLGRHVVLLSVRLAQLEQKINQLVYPGGGQEALSWETEHQQRPRYAQIVLGTFFRRSSQQ